MSLCMHVGWLGVAVDVVVASSNKQGVLWAILCCRELEDQQVVDVWHHCPQVSSRQLEWYPIADAQCLFVPDP